MDAIGGKDKKIILAGDRVGSAFRIRDYKLLHLIVTKCPADTQLPINSIMEDEAMGSLDSLALVLPVGGMLGVELLPAAVLVGQGGDGVTNVGHGQTTVKNEAK